MKQIVQSPRSGELELLEVPVPEAGPGQVLVRTAYSVVSAGTEKLALDFARSSLLAKARSRPDLVRQVTRKLRQDGLRATVQTVTSRLEAPQPLGYSCAGVVEALGEGVRGFAIGDRVACAGAGHANHAEFNAVPENLVARVPEGVALEDAAHTTLGAIALQGLRLARPELGEIAALIGLGLIGQLALQLLRANGCRVLALDIDPARVEAALAQGAEWAFTPDALPANWGDSVAEGHGADLALVTAAAPDSRPIQLAADLCRRRGRISLVGAMPMDLDRRSFYEKELELRVSMSYGPGRYDRRYEEDGLDYPLPFVRWTENRNLQAFLALLAERRVQPAAIEHESVDFAAAGSVYEDLAAGTRRATSIVLRYAADAPAERTLTVASAAAAACADAGAIGVAFLGAGNYARSVLLPALPRDANLRRIALVTATGPSARRSAEKFDFERCSTDPGAVLADPAVGLVFIATRHDSHAALACEALRQGKAVWLEKPLGLSAEEVEAVLDTARERGGFLTLGYNRRFSPHARAVKESFAQRSGPLAIRYTVAAGPPPSGSWITDPRLGGGRILGEVCHFVDLCSFWVGASPHRVHASPIGRPPQRDDSCVATLEYPDGSVALIEYLSAASPDLPKERYEISCQGGTAQGENFRWTRPPSGRRLRTSGQDKGQAGAVAAVLAALRAGAPSPFTLAELAGVSHTTFAIEQSLASGQVQEIATWPR